MKKTRRIVIALAACCAPTFVVAASDDADDDKIIVEGLRLKTLSTETGSSVSIITAADIELRGYQFALDAVAGAPGVTVNQNGSLGGLATVRIRGASSDQTLVLLDGVPLGDPTSVGGGFDFSVVDAVDIERIEILKGPQSTLWGSDAIGGVVNIITKRPEDGFGARGFVEGGSYKTYRGGASVNAASDVGDIRLAVSTISSDGISKADEDDGNTEADEYEGLTLSGNGGLNLPYGVRLEGVARYSDAETDIDGFPPPTFALADSADSSETEQLTLAGTLIAPLFDEAFENRFMIGFTDLERRGEFGGFATLDEGDRLILRYQGTAEIHPRIRAAFGAEREEAQANGGKTSIDALFGLAEVEPADGLTLTAGVRRDDHSRFGTETTARVAGAYALSPNLTLRGSWGQGFKAPTIFQLTSTFGALPPNADLQPETSDAFDVGFDFTLAQSGVRGSVSYFDRDTENLIIFAPNFRYENLDATTARGIESQIDIALTDFVTLSANHAFIDAEDRTTGERQIRVPRHSADVALSYDNGRLSGAVVLRYNGAETEGPFGSDVDEWFRVDLSAAYVVSEQVELYGRIENLLDEDYQQVSGFGTPDLSAYAGVRLNL